VISFDKVNTFLENFCSAVKAWPLLEQKDVNSSFGVNPSFLKSTAIFFSNIRPKKLIESPLFFIVLALAKKILF
jgi:hypothetical protein